MHRICVTNDVQNIIIMAVSFKAILLPHQAKADGTNFVRVRMTHQRRSKYFKTNICISPKDLTKSGKIKSQDALDQIDDLLRRMRRVASEMDMFRLKNMDIEEVYDYIDGQLSEPEEFVLDFVEFGMKVADKKSKGTGDVYRTSMNALLRFFKGRHPDISEITVRNLRKFEEFMQGQKEFPKTILEKRQNELQNMLESNASFRIKVQALLKEAEAAESDKKGNS